MPLKRDFLLLVDALDTKIYQTLRILKGFLELVVKHMNLKNIFQV